MSKLYVMCGLPRSGKSTIAKNWSEYLISIDERGRTKFFLQEGNFIPKRVVVSPDSIRLSLGHRFNWHVEPFVHATSQIMVKTLLNDNYDVLVDCTNTTEESLTKWFYFDNEAIVVPIKTDVGECISRAKNTNQSDLIPVIQRMYENMINNFGHNFVKLDEVVEKIKNKVKSNASVGAIV